MKGQQFARKKARESQNGIFILVQQQVLFFIPLTIRALSALHRVPSRTQSKWFYRASQSPHRRQSPCK